MSGSVWLNPPRAPRGRAGQTLSRDQVAAAAVHLADSGGLESVTMRSVAERLGISAMSLYWYVESKSQILELMIESAFREQEAPRGEDWPAILRSYARGVRRRFEAHPWLDATRDRQYRVPPPAQLVLYERMMRALIAKQPDLSAAQLRMIIAVLNHVVAGHASVPFPGALAGRAVDPAVRNYMTGVILDAGLSTMAHFADEVVAAAQDPFDEEIDIVIRGLAPFFDDCG